MSSSAPSGTGTGNVMYFMCEKKSPYTSTWTMRRCAFNCDTRYLYYSSKALNLSSPWKKVMKVTSLIVPAEAEDFDVKKLFVRDNNTDGDHSDRNLYAFQLQGIYRNIMAHAAPPSKVMPNASTFQRSHRGWPSKHSPRGDAFQRDKTVTYAWRCDSQELLNKLVDTVRDVLADDGLCPPIHEGLPPCDPRNHIPLAHIPLYLGKPFKGLERTVFYAFERGDMIGQGPNGQVGTAIAGGFLCITDQMVLLMRPDGTVPRWSSLTAIEAVEYNVSKAKLPFVAILTRSPAAPDIVFVPSPPLLTSEERRAYSGAEHAEKIVSLLVKVNRFLGSTLQVCKEDASPSVRTYVESKNASKRPLRFIPQEGYSEPLAFPLPKAQLAQSSAATHTTEEKKRVQEQHQQQAQRVAPSDDTIDVGDIELKQGTSGGGHGKHGRVHAALAQAMSVSFVPANQAYGETPEQQQRYQTTDEVVLPPESSDDDGAVDADPDLQIPADAPASPPQGRPQAANDDVDDIDLSDSMDDFLLDDPALNPRSSGRAHPDAHGNQAEHAGGTTLEDLINKSFAAFPS